jgi:hypothetical protein
MAILTARRFQDWFIASSGLGLVVAGMAALDETSRGYLVDAAHGEFPAMPPWLQYHTIVKHVSDVLPVDNPSFVVFGVVALVLVFVMFRM